MKLLKNQKAPEFTTRDVYGNEINVEKLLGKRIYLAFERNAGCPVCNLRTHELLKESDHFITNNVTVVMVYESPAAKMLEYLGDGVYPFHYVADPLNELYNLYGVERSWISVFAGLFHGLADKVKDGYKLFKKPMKQDGPLNRIPAEFIIDERGNLVQAHYGKFMGDHLPIEYLKNATRVNINSPVLL